MMRRPEGVTDRFASRRSRSLGSLATLFIAVVSIVAQLVAAPVAVAAADEPTNLAIGAVTGARYTAPWNSLGAINDGITPTSAGLGQMWGSYSGDRPAEEWISYSWAEPVTLTRSVISFWADAAGPGTGDNVYAPTSWRLQYLPIGSTVWTDVPGADAFGVSLTAANVSNFPAVTTSSVRALMQASGNAAGTSFAALSVTEWEAWGTAAPVVPPSTSDPLAMDEVNLPVAAGSLPTLPATVWATFTDGVRRALTVTWPAVTAAQVATPGTTSTIRGAAAGVSTPVLATLYVRSPGAAPAAQATRPVSALTVVGTAPQLPATVSVEYDDGSVDSRIPVSWSPVAAADYAAAGVVSVDGVADIGGDATLPAQALVVVDEPALTDQPPLVGLTTDSEPPSSGWFTGPVQLTATASSATDPNPIVEIEIDGGAWQQVTGPVTVTADGVHSVQARATDADGRVSAIRTSTVRIDTTAPVTTVTTDQRDADVLLTLGATDAGSGVASTQYQVGDGFIAAYTGPVPVARIATVQTVRFFSTDAAGNVETARTVEIPPSATASGVAVVRVSSVDEPSVGGWYQQPVFVSLSSPVAGQRVQYRVNDGGWRSYSSLITVAADGVSRIDHRLVVGSSVVAGSDAQVVVKVDRRAPSMSAVRSPGGGVGSPRNPFEVSFGAVDAVSGVSRAEYRVNDGAWQVVSAVPVRFDVVGDYVVAYRAVDGAGNVSVVKSLSFSVRTDVQVSVKTTVRSVRVGESVTLVVAGFRRWDTVDLTVGGVSWGSVVTDVNGAGRVTVKVPAATSVGVVSVVGVGTDPAVTATATVTITK